MSNQHPPAVPLAIEQVIAALAELEVVLGEPARQAVPQVRQRLTEAMAARDRGDPVGTLRKIGEAMEHLAALADRLDPGEAALMRAVSERFRTALLRGSMGEAKQHAGTMFERSGTREKK